MDRRRIAGIMLDRNTYRTLCKIIMIKKNFFDDHSASMSNIVNDALNEYLINHDGEIKKLIDEYHKKGGCAEL